MTKPLPFITLEQSKGVEKLLKWAVDKYKNCSGVNAKRMWKEKINFLAEVKRQQTYTEEVKVIFNGIRKEYITEKTLDKYSDLGKGTL